MKNDTTYIFQLAEQLQQGKTILYPTDNMTLVILFFCKYFNIYSKKGLFPIGAIGFGKSVITLLKKKWSTPV